MIQRNTKSAVLPQCHNRRDSLIYLFFISVGIIIAGQILGAPFIVLLSDGTPAYVQSAAEYFFFNIGTWGIFFLLMLASKKNRPIIYALRKKPRGNTPKMLMLGFAAGFGLNAVCIFAAVINRDISLTYVAFEPIKIALLFCSVFVQASSEEVLCRVFIYQRLRRGYDDAWVAIIGNSVLFAIVHLTNSGITVFSLLNIFLFGLLFSVTVYWLDSAWGAMAIHTAWNFSQNILFGLPNSGAPAYYSVFGLDTATARDSFFYTTEFGLEGTLCTTVVLTSTIAALYYYAKKHQLTSRSVWEA